MRRVGGLLVAAALYTAFGLAAQRALLPLLGSHVYAQALPGNDSLLHVWSLAWGQHALATEPRRVLDANIFAPYPLTLLYSDHLLGLAVLLAPLRLATDNVVAVHNVLIVIAPILNALAMFLLVRDLTGRADAALIGGFLYGFAPLRLEADRTQVQMLAAWWLPLLLLYGRRAIVTGRVGAAVAAGVSLVGLGTSTIYLTAFFAPFLALAHLLWAARFPPARHRRGWAALVAAEAAACLALLPFAVAYRRVQESLGTVRSPVLSGLLTLGNSLDVSAAYLPVVVVGLLGAALVVAWRRLPAHLRPERAFHVALAGGAMVLAFGPALPLPFGWGRIWGPYGLLMSLPGFTALRAPGRMIHVALVGISVLAALGFVAATARWSRNRRVAMAVSVLALAAVECWTPRFPLAAAPPPARLDAVYPWLATQPDAVHVVELPVDEWLFLAQTYQYASTGHWRRTLGGSMGIVPPAYPYMVRTLQDVPDPAVLADLRALGITDVVVHGRLMGREKRRALDTRLRASRHWLKPRWMFAGTTVYAIRPDLRPTPRTPTGSPLPRDGWRATANHDATRAAAAIDADPSTTWSSWGDLEANLRTRWYDPVPFFDRWKEFLAAQPTTLTVDLGAERSITGLAARFAGTDPMALPHVRVESSLDGTTWRPLAGPLAPLPDVTALVDRAAELPMGLAFEAPVSMRYLRFSSDGFEWRVADVQLRGS